MGLRLIDILDASQIIVLSKNQNKYKHALNGFFRSFEMWQRVSRSIRYEKVETSFEALS